MEPRMPPHQRVIPSEEGSLFMEILAFLGILAAFIVIGGVAVGLLTTPVWNAGFILGTTLSMVLHIISGALLTIYFWDFLKAPDNWNPTWRMSNITVIILTLAIFSVYQLLYEYSMQEGLIASGLLAVYWFFAFRNGSVD